MKKQNQDWKPEHLATVMDRAKQERKALRGQFTKCANKLEEALSTVPVPPSTITINAAFNTLSEKRQKLVEVDNRMFSLWLDVQDLNNEEFEKDLDTTEEYSLRWFTMESMYKEATAKLEREGSDSNSKTADNYTRLLKLPKLELPEFDGDIKKRTNLFSTKIHYDEKIAGSTAQDYPPTAANYEKVRQQLEDSKTQVSLNLFGGVVTKKEMSIDDNDDTKMQSVEQVTLCGDLPTALKEKGIEVNGCAAEVMERSLLIGTDFLCWTLQGTELSSSSDTDIVRRTTFDPGGPDGWLQPRGAGEGGQGPAGAADAAAAPAGGSCAGAGGC